MAQSQVPGGVGASEVGAGNPTAPSPAAMMSQHQQMQKNNMLNCPPSTAPGAYPQYQTAAQQVGPVNLYNLYRIDVLKEL